jgi:hypothetical protein
MATRSPDTCGPVCDLGALGASRSRHRKLLERVLGSALVAEETAEGWRVELPAEPRLFRAAAAWVALERRCCPFVSFALEWTRDGTVRLVAATDEPGRAALRAGLAAALGAAGGSPGG